MMFEWLSEQYIQLIANSNILLGYFVDCYAVERLRLLTLALFTLLILKVGIHLTVYQRLRRNFSEYSGQSDPYLMKIFNHAIAKVKLKRLPLLYKFSNQKPLLFTIGTLRPAIFIAPIVSEKLSEEELEAALTHELSHIKHFDILFSWLLEFLFVVMPLLVVQFFAFYFVFNGTNSQIAIWGTVVLIIAFRVFAWRRIFFFRELSCDDRSIQAEANPLTLASALVKVCRLGNPLPRHRWKYGLAFAQTLLATGPRIENRVQRLINYKTPKLKQFIVKAVRITVMTLLIGIFLFLWRFHTAYGLVKVRISHIHGNDCAHQIVLVDD